MDVFMDLHPLLELLADGGFHSGEELGSSLGISRTAVWKQIDRLRGMGVEVHAVTGKGYRLPTMLPLMSESRIFHHLGPHAESWRGALRLVFSTESTNADAMQIAQAGSEHYVVIAEHQTKGRGRRGRIWVSPPGANIYMSLLVSFQNGAAALEGLSLVAALLIVDALHKCGYRGFGVKWPNDILLGKKKLAGILLEISGDLVGSCKVVVGIGLNVKLPPSASEKIDQPHTDLVSSFDSPPDRDKIASALISVLGEGFKRFKSSGFESFREQWNQLDVYKGTVVEVSAGKNCVRGYVLGVSGSGALLLETDAGVREVSGGELMPTLRSAAWELNNDT
jgi:BirA family biotin operon repressor/biotin-[acetyl-CoA-carboxylase] ligase